MTIRVLFFAALAKRLDTRAMELELSAGSTVSDALDALQARFEPFDGHFRRTLATAVNHEYVDALHVLGDGDELALIGPVSGG